jgi:hypothetical protein
MTLPKKHSPFWIKVLGPLCAAMIFGHIEPADNGPLNPSVASYGNPAFPEMHHGPENEPAEGPYIETASIVASGAASVVPVDRIYSPRWTVAPGYLPGPSPTPG